MLQIIAVALLDIFFIYATIRLGDEMGSYIWLYIGCIAFLTLWVILGIINYYRYRK